MVLQGWLLHMGTLNLDNSILYMGRGFGVKSVVPICTFLLKTETDGYILIDTGMNPSGVDDPQTAWGDRAKILVPNIEKDDDIRLRLENIGVDPTNINIVINTHLHWDHTGGNRFFPQARFIVQKAEYLFAFNPDKALSASYMANHFDYPLNYEQIDGDMQVADGVHVLMTPGHTPGHQSVFLRFRSGAQIIICGDAIYTKQNYSDGIMSGNLYDYRLALQSYYKLKSIAELTGAEVIPSHDPSPGFFADTEELIKNASA